MDLTGAATATARATPATPPQSTKTAQVVRSDESGLWVVPLGEDINHPIGPCKGGWTANGTRVPPGALVALVLTADGPWAIGVDNPALAIADGTLAPFSNPSFEAPVLDGLGVQQPQDWGGFGLFGSVSSGELITGAGAAHGQRHWRITKNGVGALFLQSTAWSMAPGSSFETSFYARRVSGDPRVAAYLFTTAPGDGGPSVVNPNSVLTSTPYQAPTDDWLRYMSTATPPATHTNVALLLAVISGDGNDCVVDLDYADADLVILDASVQNQDFIRRATATLTGGGIRTVTAGGNVSWTQPFTIAGAGRTAATAADGRFEIAMPGNGTVLPVHSSGTRTSHTIAGGVIALDPDEALWYELPIGSGAASAPGNFHILGSSLADDFEAPPHWILVVRRNIWGASNHAPEYKWGTGAVQDPWRTPTLNAGWNDGTIPGRYTKTSDGQVQLRGRVRDGAGSVFTLPAGYTPPEQHEAIVRDGAGAPALLTVTTAGVVTTAGNNTDHSIATIFPVQ